METTTQHEISPADSTSQWTYCTVCGKDISAQADSRTGKRRHFTTKKATIAKRIGA